VWEKNHHFSISNYALEMLQIPFPAVTICPKIFAKSKHINLTALVESLNILERYPDELTEKE
jgi:hypothetical protein